MMSICIDMCCVRLLVCMCPVCIYLCVGYEIIVLGKSMGERGERGGDRNPLPTMMVQLAFTCSKSKMVTPEECVIFIQS